MLKLILPVLFPSWRFFSGIGASPRIQIALLNTADAIPEDWQEFRPRPAQLGFVQGLLRLFHNPQWNESLYLNTCAERIFEGNVSFYGEEICQRIAKALANGEVTTGDAAFWRYRILALESERGAISQIEVLVSDPQVICTVSSD